MAREYDDGEDDRARDGAPPAPEIPSLASLRSPARRSALDLLVPERPAGPPARPARPAPRPPEYADLLLLGRVVVRSLAGLPGRCLRRLLTR
ncbi:hypothetical protein [Blastococcus sp. SYSU D00820]